MDELVRGAARSPGSDSDRTVAVFGDPRLSDATGSFRVSGHAGRLLAGLVERRRGASIEQLIDVVWPSDPPRSARAALHVHLGRLRRVLDELVDGPVVERSGQTYRLCLDGWTVDVDRFHELRRRAAAAPDGSAAADLLSEALHVANGPAFVVDGESVAPAATHQIALARLDAEEEFVDALLAADRSADAERVAVDLVACEPFRERRWSLLMRAQGVQGRCADALATYQRARRTLVDELGLEPGEELRRTQLLVLSGEAEQLRSDPAPTEEFERPPRVLGALIGREAAVDRVESALAQGTPAIVVGAPGAGKTRLAIEVARRAGVRGVEVAWLDFRNIAFGNTAFSDEIARWVRRHPGGLVVIDNAEANETATVEITHTVSRVSPEVGLVVTSRAPLRIEALVERLDPLSLPDGATDLEIEQSAAVRLLRELLVFRAPDAKFDSALAAELVARVSGLPLGIRLVADLAATVPPDRMLDRTVASLQSEIEPAVGAVLAGLGERDRVVFESASVVPGQLDAELIAALAGQGDVTGPVSRLCEHGLFQFDAARPEAPYSMLEPLRDVAVELLERSGRRGDVMEGLVGECVRRAKAVALPGRDTGETFPLQVRLDRELPWHRQAIAHAVRHGDGEPALQICAGLELSLYALGWWETNTRLQDAALATPGEPTSARARVHAARGRPGLLHEFDEFHLGRAAEIAAQIGDRPVEAKALYSLGVKRWWDRRYDEALDLLARAAEIAVACRDRFVEQESIRYSGITLVSAGRADEGFAIQLDVLRKVQASRNSEFLLPHVQMYLGHCRRHVGDDDAAFVDLEQARQAYERTTNMASLVHLYAALAEMSIDRGASATALRHAARALELSARGGVSAYDPWLLCTIARVHAHAGDDIAARHSASAAIGSLERGWVGETHRVAVELASVASQLGDHWSATRLIGLADAAEDRRDLPFVSPAETRRASSVRDAIGADGGLAEAYELGAASTISEAASRLIAPVLVA